MTIEKANELLHEVMDYFEADWGDMVESNEVVPLNAELQLKERIEEYLESQLGGNRVTSALYRAVSGFRLMLFLVLWTGVLGQGAEVIRVGNGWAWMEYKWSWISFLATSLFYSGIAAFAFWLP